MATTLLPEQKLKAETDAFLASLSNTSDLKRQGFFPMSLWGKDHWSLLAYIGCRNADNNSIVDYSHFRVNEKRHPYANKPFPWQDD
jgi:hypothetical protein